MNRNAAVNDSEALSAIPYERHGEDNMLRPLGTFLGTLAAIPIGSPIGEQRQVVPYKYAHNCYPCLLYIMLMHLDHLEYISRAAANSCASSHGFQRSGCAVDLDTILSKLTSCIDHGESHSIH